MDHVVSVKTVDATENYSVTWPKFVFIFFWAFSVNDLIFAGGGRKFAQKFSPVSRSGLATQLKSNFWNIQAVVDHSFQLM